LVLTQASTHGGHVRSSLQVRPNAHPHLQIGGGKKGVLYPIDINHMGDPLQDEQDRVLAG
jgi:hypothetical protein